jgi:hypothetical protein
MLRLTCFQKPSDAHNNYRYLVTDTALPHTAFRHTASLKRWLKERNLELKLISRWENERDGKVAYFEIMGSYMQVSMLNAEEFDRISAPTTQEMSNGSYTLAKIVDDGNWIKIVYLNPNVNRATFDYFKTNQTHG